MTHPVSSKDILVSTIIPSYNKHHFLKEAIFSALQQTHDNQEIIIINDYPTEEAKDIVNDFKNLDWRIKVIHNSKNIGIASSRNKAISCSKWKLIAMLDHDDLWADNEKISKQIAVFESDKNIGVVWSQYYTIDSEGNIIKPVHFPLSDIEIRKKINMGMPSLQSSLVFQKQLLDTIWGFDARVSMTDDYEILFRALRLSTMKNLSDYTTHYRLHENTSRNIHNTRIMICNSLHVLLQQWVDYPHYVKAVLKRLLWWVPYWMIRPYLWDELVEKAKSMRNKLLWRTNQ